MKFTAYIGTYTDDQRFMQPVFEFRKRVGSIEGGDIERAAEKILTKKLGATSVVWNDVNLGTIVGGSFDGETILIDAENTRWQDYR